MDVDRNVWHYVQRASALVREGNTALQTVNCNVDSDKLVTNSKTNASSVIYSLTTQIGQVVTVTKSGCNTEYPTK